MSVAHAQIPNDLHAIYSRMRVVHQIHSSETVTGRISNNQVVLWTQVDRANDLRMFASKDQRLQHHGDVVMGIASFLVAAMAAFGWTKIQAVYCYFFICRELIDVTAYTKSDTLPWYDRIVDEIRKEEEARGGCCSCCSCCPGTPTPVGQKIDPQSPATAVPMVGTPAVVQQGGATGGGVVMMTTTQQPMVQVQQASNMIPLQTGGMIQMQQPMVAQAQPGVVVQQQGQAVGGAAQPVMMTMEQFQQFQQMQMMQQQGGVVVMPQAAQPAGPAMQPVQQPMIVVTQNSVPDTRTEAAKVAEAA